MSSRTAVMINCIARIREAGSGSTVLIRADTPLYLFILVYTIVGVACLELSSAWNEAAYDNYFVNWAVLYGLAFPGFALLLDFAYLIHRFDRRRLLAARRMISVRRLAQLIAGMVLLQAMTFFMGTFTSIKNLLSEWHGGFPYDRLHADIDKLLHFGVDPWRWLGFAQHDWIRAAVQWNYLIGFMLFCFGGLFFVATSPAMQAIRMRYIFAFMLVFIVVGNVLAGMFLSAGPAFYGLVTGDEARFAEQLTFLARGVDLPNSAAFYQSYLWDRYINDQAGFGSGISAFPSVHVGLVTMNALFLAERDRRLGIAGFGYVALIMASSVYLGWHYAIDGYVAIATITAIHFALKRFRMPRAFVEMKGSEAARPVAVS
jgi:hypothetical protein